ncbi:MAG TPA: hypothetical protein ENJ82_14360, partial [Bacteroidetes bacterium]|nr:hypothetical protein [Bacteroidota bacterium]
MNRTYKSLQYLFLDLLVSYGAWMIFFLMRRYVFENDTFAYNDHKVFLQMVPAAIISLYWLFLYTLAGLYSKPYRKSRLREMLQVLRFTLLGVLFIFFFIFLDDLKPTTTSYRFYLYYFLIQFSAISLVHFLISTQTNLRLRSRKIGFPTLVIGCGPTAYKIWNELESRSRSLGYKFAGFITLPGVKDNQFYGKLKNYGEIDRLHEV